MTVKRKNVSFPPFDLHGLVAVPKRECDNLIFFCNVVVPDLLRNTMKNAEMLGNALDHNSKRFREALEANGTIRVPHPAYSPDIAPSDFYVFTDMKERLRSVTVMDRNSLMSVITELLSRKMNSLRSIGTG
jgi:hypothetical protein